MLAVQRTYLRVEFYCPELPWEAGNRRSTKRPSSCHAGYFDIRRHRALSDLYFHAYFRFFLRLDDLPVAMFAAFGPPVTDLQADAAVVARRRQGVIEVANGEFCALRFRRWAYRPSWLGIKLWGAWRKRRTVGDRCLLYYHQPLAFPQFLALSYIESTRDARLATFRRAVRVLDEIAAIKQSDAILCEASNHRISDRLFKRWGWVAHAPMRGRRNFIKRLYEPVAC